MKNKALLYLILFLGITLNKPIQATPQSSGRIYNVNIAGQGTNATIDENSDFTVSFSYQVWNGWEGGGGCIVYIPVGLGFSRTVLLTPYNDAEGCGVPGYYPGDNGNATLQLRTPSVSSDTRFGIFFNFYEVVSASQACDVFRTEYSTIAGHYPVYGTVLVTNDGIAEQKDESVVSNLQVSPNPTLNNATIKITLANTEGVTIKIYDIAGQIVRTLTQSTFNKGDHQLIWDCCDNNNKRVPAGIYTCEIATEKGKEIKQMIVVK